MIVIVFQMSRITLSIVLLCLEFLPIHKHMRTHTHTHSIQHICALNPFDCMTYCANSQNSRELLHRLFLFASHVPYSCSLYWHLALYFMNLWFDIFVSGCCFCFFLWEHGNSMWIRKKKIGRNYMLQKLQNPIHKIIQYQTNWNAIWHWNESQVGYKWGKKISP